MKFLYAILPAALFTVLPLHAQQDPKALVAAAVRTELNADHTDTTAFEYRDHDLTPDHDTLFLVIETPQGTLRRKLEDHGRPLTPQERHIEDLRIHAFVTDPSLQERQRRDGAHDDAQAQALLNLLPAAFVWTVKAETPALTTLAYKPDPAFHPQTMEARVLSAMSGEIVVAREAHRIQTIRGTLTDDVKIGFGVLGRLRAGGTFDVERREVVPGHWQITASHVHIDGKALFFKTIGQQEDETKSAFRLSPATTLPQAAEALKDTK